MRNLTCTEISTEQKAPLVSHYGLLGTREAQKVGGKNEPSKNGISSEQTTGDQNQAPNRIQDEQTNNMQCSKTNFGQKLGTTQICKLGENRKTGISKKLEIVGEKQKHIIKEKNTTDKVTMTESEKTSSENSKIIKSKTRHKPYLSLLSF